MTRLDRPRRVRVARALVLGLIAVVLLFGFDGSRQPTSGNGWRILGYQRASGHVNTILAIPDQAALNADWKSLYLHGQPAVVDFDQAAVFWFTGVGTIGCPSRFNGLEFDAGARTVTASFSLAVTAGCDANRVPDAFLVAVDRAKLPAGRYTVQIGGVTAATAPGSRIEVGS